MRIRNIFRMRNRVLLEPACPLHLLSYALLLLTHKLIGIIGQLVINKRMPDVNCSSNVQRPSVASVLVIKLKQFYAKKNYVVFT